jgi:hypothetical protein
MLRTRIAAVLSVLVCVFAMNAVMGNSADDPTDVLPGELFGWQVLADRSTAYDRETLYDYIDGGAELYLSYDFQRVVHRTYARDGVQGNSEILVDVFDMGSSRNAFGVFSHSRETVESEFGQGSQYTAGLMLFWKGRYYVSILASPETEASKRAVYELAKRIDGAIASEGPPPAIVAILPRDGLVEESIRYFRHYIWLNSHYYVSDENLLGIDQTTEAVLATYGSGTGRRILLVVDYPDTASATAAYKSFTAGYMPELADGSAVRIEDGTWAGCRASGDVLAVVFNAPTEADANHLIDAVVESR